MPTYTVPCECCRQGCCFDECPQNPPACNHPCGCYVPTCSNTNPSVETGVNTGSPGDVTNPRCGCNNRAGGYWHQYTLTATATMVCNPLNGGVPYPCQDCSPISGTFVLTHQGSGHYVSRQNFIPRDNNNCFFLLNGSNGLVTHPDTGVRGQWAWTMNMNCGIVGANSAGHWFACNGNGGNTFNRYNCWRTHNPFPFPEPPGWKPFNPSRLKPYCLCGGTLPDDCGGWTGQNSPPCRVSGAVTIAPVGGTWVNCGRAEPDCGLGMLSLLAISEDDEAPGEAPTPSPKKKGCGCGGGASVSSVKTEADRRRVEKLKRDALRTVRK